MIPIEILNLDYILYGKFIQINSKYVPFVLSVASVHIPNDVRTAVIDLRLEFYMSRRIRKLYSPRKRYVCDASRVEHLKFNELKKWLDQFFIEDDNCFWPSIFGTFGHRQTSFFEHYVPRIENCEEIDRLYENSNHSCIRCITKTRCEEYVKIRKTHSAWQEHLNGMKNI